MASNFSVIFFIRSLRVRLFFFFFLTHALQEKIIAKLVNSENKFYSKNGYRTHRFAWVFSLKLTMEFTSKAMNFSIEESKENGLIKTRTIRNLIF